MRNHLIESCGELLDDRGHLVEAGYALSPVFKYDASKIRAPFHRIKEWDYYLVTTDDFAVAFTVSDQRYMCLNTIGVIDLKTGRADTLSELKPFSRGRKFASPGESHANGCSSKKLCIEYSDEDGGVRIKASAPNFFGEEFSCDILLTDFPRDNMVIATPFHNPKYFYYNQKINCITASGSVKLGARTVELSGAQACYDCGRGAWTLKNVWYWATCSTTVNGEKFGFNLGYGFGDTSAASENMLFYKGEAHKLDDVVIDIPKGKNGKHDYLAREWGYKDDKNRLNLIFEPVALRYDRLGAIVPRTIQNQTFGYFSGECTLDDGTVIKLDRALGACEVFDNIG